MYMPHTFLVLDNIRSAYNVGAILRTADAAGVEAVYCCGTTPMPTDRFGRKRADIAKTALGAEETVETVYYNTARACVQELQKQGVAVVAVEQTEHSVLYTAHTVEQNTALVFGDEVRGVSKDVLDICNTHIEIPMHGEKESLNVSVAVGVVLYGLQKR